MRFLFWNLGGNRVQQVLATIAHTFDAECEIAPSEMLLSLNQPSQTEYHRIESVGCEKIECCARFSSDFFRSLAEWDRVSIRQLALPGVLDILVASVHLVDARNWSRESQASECRWLINEIEHAERRVGHQRTVLVGDFNMDPFGSGVVDANGLHGVMSRHIAQEAKRTIQSRERTFFYNPMWRLLGDDSGAAPGSYYYRNAEPVLYFWHMFDQVMLRPELLPHFQHEKLAVLSQVGERSLLTRNGIPDRNISDHLPLLFGLDL
jgi:hypothetical protein